MRSTASDEGIVTMSVKALAYWIFLSRWNSLETSRAVVRIVAYGEDLLPG